MEWGFVVGIRPYTVGEEGLKGGREEEMGAEFLTRKYWGQGRGWGF